MSDGDLVKTTQPGIYKNESTGMCVNKNMHEYESVLAQRQRYRDEQRNAQEIERIKTEVSDMRAVLDKILEAVSSR